MATEAGSERSPPPFFRRRQTKNAAPSGAARDRGESGPQNVKIWPGVGSAGALGSCSTGARLMIGGGGSTAKRAAADVITASRRGGGAAGAGAGRAGNGRRPPPSEPPRSARI